jgi:nitrogen fixation protein NifU and related proteins
VENTSREHILDHYENPHHNCELDGAEISCERTTPLCGDRIRVDIKLNPDRTSIADACFQGDGCIISQAAASMLMDEIIGKQLGDVITLEPQRILDLIGVPLTAQRVKCALLGLQTAKDGIRGWQEANSCAA